MADAPLFSNDIRLLAPGSRLLDRDLSDHKFTNDRYEVGTGSFEASIGLRPFRRADKMGPELRVGVIYAGLVDQSAALRRTTRMSYDTLTSSQTGVQTFVDSVFRDNIRLRHSAERIGVSASLIWRTQGRWSLYGGVGVAGGPTLNARSEVRSDETRSTEIRDFTQGEVYGSDFNASDDVELFRNGNGWWLATYLPIGLDFQLARTGTFFSRLHLFYEIRPQMVFQGSPELGSNSAFGMQTVFGLRLRL